MVKGFINHDRQKSILYIFMDICLVSWIKYNYTKTSVLIKSIFFVGPQMTLGVYFLSVQNPQILPLKVVFAKNERGYRFTAMNNRFWSLLILLLSVASIRRKFLKTSHTEEQSVHTNWGILDRKKIKLISNK